MNETVWKKITRWVGGLKDFFIAANPAARDLGLTKSGVLVTQESALTFSAVFAAVKVLAESVSTLPLHLYRRTGNGKDMARDHALFPLLHDLPNPELTSCEFREIQMAALALWGNAYAEIERNALGEILALWPIHPSRVEVRRPSPDAPLEYQVTMPTGGRVMIPKSRMFHLRALALDGVVGISPVRLHRETIALGLAATEFGARFFGQGMMAGGVLQHPGTLSSQAYDRLEKSIEQQRSGLPQSHRLLLLEEGMKYEKLTIPPDDAQWLGTRLFQVSEVARIFNLPPHKLKDLSRATFCLPADAEVFTVEGPRCIVDVRSGDLVWSRDTSGWVKARVARSSMTGHDGILTIRTTNRTLRANARHRVLARRKVPALVGPRGGHQRVRWVDEWIPAGALLVGDTIVTVGQFVDDGLTCCPTRAVSEGFAEFCGLLLGDGNVSMAHGEPVGVQIARAPGAPHMEHYRRVMVEEFRRYAGGNGRGDLAAVALAPVRLCEDQRQTKFRSVLAARELVLLGLSGTARTKRVPGWAFTLSAGLRLAILRGFLDADGSVDKLGRVSFSSCNQTMLSQIRHLCMGLGIPVTNLRCQQGQTRLPNGRFAAFEQWTFTCSDPGSNLRVGSHTPEYVRRMTAGHPFSRKGRAYPWHGGRGFKKGAVDLARITSIEQSTVVEPVYDLEVEGPHSFIADGVVVHNSNIEEQSIEFVTDSLMPWLVRWEQAIARDLLGPDERPDLFARFRVEGLLRGKTLERYQAYAIGRQWGWESVNSILDLEDRNPIGPEGDIYLSPLNMVSAEQALRRVQDDPNLEMEQDEGIDAEGRPRRRLTVRRRADVTALVEKALVAANGGHR